MKSPRIIVVGASAGGVEALVKFVSGFQMDREAAAFIVLHIPADRPSLLPEILTRKSTHSVSQARNDEIVKAGNIYIGPPDYHMILSDGRIELTRGPRINRHRPSIDELFTSAARTYGPRVIGIILSGSMNDGAIGVAAIKRAGGTIIVQDPDDALVPSMPQHAMAAAKPDFVVAAADMGPLVSHLVQEEAQADPPNDNNSHRDPMDIEAKIQQDLAKEAIDGVDDNQQSVLTCPECGGVLWEHRDGGTTSFSCHEGHKLTAESMIAGQSQKIEEALWTAVRLLKEKAVLCRKLATQMQNKGSQRSAESFGDQAEALEQHVLVLRNQLIHDESLELAGVVAESS